MKNSKDLFPEIDAWEGKLFYPLANYSTFVRNKYDFDAIAQRSAAVNGHAGVIEFDLYILGEYIEFFGIKKVIELGCGTSTKFLRTFEDIEVHTYAIDCDNQDPGPIEHDNHTLTFLDISENNISTIVEAAKDADLIVIDADHEQKFVELYYKKLLCEVKKPAFIHDFFITKNVWSEELYLKEVLVEENEFSIFITTDLPPSCFEIMENLTGADLGGSNVPTRPVPCCSVIIEPIK